MEAKIRNGNLHIVLPLEDPHISASGKTLVVASSRGVRRSNARLDGKIISVIANAFVDVDEIDARKLERTLIKSRGRKRDLISREP